MTPQRISELLEEQKKRIAEQQQVVDYWRAQIAVAQQRLQDAERHLADMQGREKCLQGILDEWKASDE